jgi:hypothetical protein
MGRCVQVTSSLYHSLPVCREGGPLLQWEVWSLCGPQYSGLLGDPYRESVLVMAAIEEEVEGTVVLCLDMQRPVLMGSDPPCIGYVLCQCFWKTLSNYSRREGNLQKGLKGHTGKGVHQLETKDGKVLKTKHNMNH